MREDVRRLLVLRHAKAESTAATDRERSLTARGHRDAVEAGEWARAAGYVPDHAFVSTASRAHETWRDFRAGAGLRIEPVLDPALYQAGPDGALAVLRTAPTSARTVIVVGHNPTMAHLVHLLDDGGADGDTFARLTADFPTSALAVLEVTGEWAELQLGRARVADFHVGHG